MSETKQYFVLRREGGTLKVSFEAVAMQVRGACAEIDGVTGISAAEASNEWVGQRGIVIERGEGEADCRIKVYITVLYGNVITETAAAVQENVKQAVESCLSLNVTSVDVYVSGITFPKQ